MNKWNFALQYAQERDGDKRLDWGVKVTLIENVVIDWFFVRISTGYTCSKYQMLSRLISKNKWLNIQNAMLSLTLLKARSMRHISSITSISEGRENFDQVPKKRCNEIKNLWIKLKSFTGEAFFIKNIVFMRFAFDDVKFNGNGKTALNFRFSNFRERKQSST